MTLKALQGKQRGASGLVTIIVLAVIAYAAYVVIQYVPLSIESGSVDSILESIEQRHRTQPLTSVKSVKAAIETQLDVNQMLDLKDSFHVEKKEGAYVITVKFERDLNLIYGTKPVNYERTIKLW